MAILFEVGSNRSGSFQQPRRFSNPYLSMKTEITGTEDRTREWRFGSEVRRHHSQQSQAALKLHEVGVAQTPVPGPAASPGLGQLGAPV